MSNEELPPGWERRESKSQPGRYYYVSPQGQTQWFPPRRVPGIRQFNWRCEIEIEFGPGRLGVNLKEVPQTTNLPFPMFQAEVEELPKLPGGKPGPAEIYNWSVRPERRLTPGMRLTQIDGVVLAGNRYTEVVDRLKRAARPVKLKFADVAQGLLGEGETADTAPAAVAVAAPSAAAPSAYSVQKQKKEEYMNLLVTSELSNEMWRLETQKVKSQFIALQYKWNILSASFSALMEDKLKSKREIEASMTEKAKYEEMLKQLKLQESGAILSPEVQRMNELSSKNAELTDDIGKMGAANKKLRRERDLNQRQLDELEAQLVHGVSQPLPESLAGIDPLLEPSAKIEIIAQKIAAMQFELQREEMKTKQAEVELAQLSKVYNQQTEVILESSRGGMMMPLPDMRRQVERPPLPPVAESKPPLPPAPTPPPPPPQPQQQHSSFLGSSRGGFYNRSNSAQMTSANIVRQGHLEKFPTHFNQEGGGMLQSMRLMRGSRERWCQLTSTGTLVYYKKRGDPVPRGEIALTDPTLEVVCEAMSSSSSGRRPPKELIFTVSTTQAQNRFQAATMDDMRGWVTAILTFHSGWMNSRASLTENQTAPTYMDESSARRASNAACEMEKKGTDERSKIDSVRRNSVKRRMSMESRVAEKKIITIGDYHTPLPEGWTYRESTKHKGKWYYISPTGQAQWIPPLVKTGKLYEWKLQLFIEFGPGKLGMNLKAVDALPDTIWTQFQVEIHTLRKLGNGHASPAEIYNWSVKPDRRIYAGFRIVEISGTSVAGFTYSEVIEKINKTPRPLVIGFCDCYRGLVGDPDEDEDLEGDENDVLKSVYQQRFNTIQSEYMKTLVLTELDKELWNVDNKRLTQLELECRAKCARLQKEIDAIEEEREQLQAIVAQYVLEKDQFRAKLDNLHMLENKKLASIEEQRTHELAEKEQALLKAIAKTTAENQRLVDEFAVQTVKLDRLYAQLDKDESNNVMLMTKTQLYDEYGIKRGPFVLEDLHLLFFTLEEAALVEEQELQRNKAEVDELKQQLVIMNGVPGQKSEPSDASSVRDLEMKLDWLRGQLNKTMDSIARAEKKGKTKNVKAGYRRRNLLKIEYQLVQDELQTKLQQMGPQPTCPEEPALLEEKMEYIRQAMRDAAQMISTCPKNQQQLFRDRRDFLQKELERTIDRCLELGLPVNTIRRSSLGVAPVLNDRMSVMDSIRQSAFDLEDETPPGTPKFFPETLTPPPEEATTPPLQPQTPPFQAAASPLKAETPPLKPTTPPFRAVTPPFRAATPPLRAVEHQSLVPDSPPLRAETPPLKPDSPPLKADTPPFEAATSPFHISMSSSRRSESPPRKSESPPFQTPPLAAASSVDSVPYMPPLTLEPRFEAQPHIEDKPQFVEKPRFEEKSRYEEKPRYEQEAFASGFDEKPQREEKKPVAAAFVPPPSMSAVVPQPTPSPNVDVEVFGAKLHSILSDLEQKRISNGSAQSVYSLDDSEAARLSDTISICSEDMGAPSKIEQLESDLRNIVAQINQATKVHNQNLVTKLMRARNQIKSELVLAQDEMQVEQLKQDLREVVVRIAQASKHNDKAAADHWMQKRIQLKAQLRVANEAYAKSLREAKPLEELKNELRAVVKDLQKSNLTKQEIELLMQQKSELKQLIIAKQPQFIPHATDIETLKQELRKVVANISLASKENDEKLVEKLMRRRSDLKIALARAQDHERRSDKQARGSASSSTSSEGYKSNASSFMSLSDGGKRQSTKAQSFAGIKQAPNKSQWFMGSSQNEVANPEPPTRAKSQPNHQSIAGYPLSVAVAPAGGAKATSNKSFAGVPSKPEAKAPIPAEVGNSRQPNHHSIAAYSSSTSSSNHQSFTGQSAAPLPSQSNHQSFTSNSSSQSRTHDRTLVNSSFISNGSSEPNSLHDENFQMSESKVAQAALVAYREELAAIDKALDKTTNEKKIKHLLFERAEIKTRIAATEEQLLPTLPPITPLDMEWDIRHVKKHTEVLQKELREIVKRCATLDKESITGAFYMHRRGELKNAISAALDRIDQLKEEQVPEIQIPVLQPDVDRETLKAHVDILKKELRQIVSKIAQTTSLGAKNKLKSQRSTLKHHLALAQDKLATFREPPPKPSSEVQMLESYIESLKADLKQVVSQITRTQDMPTINAMNLRRRNDLKKNLRNAQDQLMALQQAEQERISQRSSSRKGSVVSSNEDEPALVIDALLSSRMTQVYQNVTEKAGFLEWMPQTLKIFRGGKVVWVKLETNGCLLWYKSPSDTKVRGMLDLAQSSTRSVKVDFGGENLICITVITPGMLANTEEVTQFRATSENEARGWVYILQDTIQTLVKQFPQQKDEDMFSRNSVVY